MMRGDIADKAGIVDMEGAAVAIPPASVAARRRPVKGQLRRRYPSPLTGGSAQERASESVCEAEARRPEPTRLRGGS